MLGSKVITGVKYVYLGVFFMLLAGLFYPLIHNAQGEIVAAGIAVLVIGLVGGLLIYKGVTSEGVAEIPLFMGFGFVGLSLFFIMTITGRI